jgi:hypothetical protein
MADPTEPEDAGCEPVPADLVELHQLLELAGLRPGDEPPPAEEIPQ